MRRFKSIGHAQLFLSVHGKMQNLSSIPRHLLRAKRYRKLRTKAYIRYARAKWPEIDTLPYSSNSISLT